MTKRFTFEKEMASVNNISLKNHAPSVYNYHYRNGAPAMIPLTYYYLQLKGYHCQKTHCRRHGIGDQLRQCTL